MDSDIRMVEIATGHVSNRNQVVPLSDISKYRFGPEQKTEVYHSWYAFDEQLKQHINGVGTIQGFNGVYYVNNIILDYDKKDLTDDALYKAVHWLVNTEMIEDLGINPEHLVIWYSGTGFHIEMPNLFGFQPSTSLPGIVKETLTTLFPECDNIYDGARLIRAGYSYNEKKSNFKIPFTVSQFNNHQMPAIIDESNKWQGIGDLDWSQYEFGDVKSYLKHLVKYPTKSEQTYTVRSQFRMDPNSVVTCMQTALNSPPVVGERNDTMMRIASWMRRWGMPERVVSHTLTEWSGLQSEAKEVARKIFETGYEYSCKDGIMAKWCKTNCIYFKHKDYNMNVMNVDDMAEDYKSFLEKDMTESSFNFKDIYQMNNDYWVLPGELVVVTGNTGMGKSTFVMNLVTQIPHLNCLFLSLENHKHLTFRRFCQMTHLMSKTQVNDAIKTSGVLKLQDAFKHIQICCDPPEISRLVDGIARSKPKVVEVDTTDMVFMKGVYDEITKMNEVIGQLKSVAQNQDCIVIAVHHVNKDAEREGFVKLGHLKGTSNTYQKADKVLTINARDNDRDSGFRMVKAEKSRDEDYMQLGFTFDKPHMLFKQVTDV